MRRAQLILRILEIIEFVGDKSADYFESNLRIMESKSLGRALLEMDKLHCKNNSNENYFRDLRQVENILYRLRKDDLISGKAGLLPLLTSEGKQKLEELKGTIHKKYLPPTDKYNREKKDKKKRMVIFDIPEDLKNKRQWLRAVLRHLGYKIIQKSVWFGVTKLPQELVLDLKRLGLLPYIHVFIVGKEGTLSGS